MGGPNPKPHSGRLQVSSESTPPSVRVATGPAGHRGRDQALSPAGPSPRSTQTMRWPGLPSARGPPMRPADASSHQGPFKAGRLLPDDVRRQPAYRTTGASAWAPWSCPSLALVTASRRYRLSVPQVRIRSSAGARGASLVCGRGRRLAAVQRRSRGGAVGVLAGASRRFAGERGGGPPGCLLPAEFAIYGLSPLPSQPGKCPLPSFRRRVRPKIS